jgi:hypothetical protein
MGRLVEISASFLLAGVLPVGLVSMLPHAVQPFCHSTVGIESSASLLVNVKSGLWCAVTIKSPMALPRNFTLSVPPQHGDVFPDGGRTLLYRSSANFRGEDAFAIVVESASAVFTAPPSVMRIKVIVN